MSRRLRLFLSSPGDVADERRQCVEAVEEINTTMRALVPERDLDLDVVRWEDDTHPDLTGSPQAVVDSQLDVDYDVFLGIMWSRFGTPTESAGSGTEHEFRAAQRGWRENRRPSHLLFYFCDAPITLADLTAAKHTQLGQVLAFREELSRLGLLGSYSDRSRFRDLVRKDLVLLMGRVLRSEQPQPTPDEIAAKVTAADLALVRHQVHELASEYGSIRGTMRSGNERTRRMEVVATRMRTMAESVYPLLTELLASADPGERLAAVCALQAIPSCTSLTWLAERLPAETPFVGYHASLALLAAARGLAPDHLDEVRVALDQAHAFAERLGPDSDRDTTLTHARRELARRMETEARG